MNTNWRGVIGFLVVIALASVAAYYGQPFISKNQDSADVLVNVFSILAGFLVAVMTIMGEPVYYRRKTWRYNKVARDNYMRSLTKHKDLFYAYLITLSLIFASRLVPDKDYECLRTWFERGFMFFATIAFIYSFFLPNKLMAKQLEKYDEQVEEKKSGF
ncbi:hypothetical protein E0X81_05995 [Halomonas sp. GDM18]|nr:hypothetical protein E0X81_05995 [Halomonas sp. GDM18]